MTETLAALLLRLSETSGPALLSGQRARPFLGPAFDRLLNTGILVEEAPETEWSTCMTCECGLDARPVQMIGERLVAACPLDRGADQVLEPDELRLFTLNRSALFAAIAERAGLTGSPYEITDGVWLLGRIPPSGACVFVACDPSAALHAGFIALAHEAARGSSISVLVSNLPEPDRVTLAQAGLSGISYEAAFYQDDLNEAIPRLDCSRLTPLGNEMALIINIAAKAAVLFGTDLALSPRSFKLLSFLAQRVVDGKALASRPEIEAAVWPTPVEKVLTADAVRELRKEISPALSPGVMATDILKTRSGQGYLLALPRDQVAVMTYVRERHT